MFHQFFPERKYASPYVICGEQGRSNVSLLHPNFVFWQVLWLMFWHVPQVTSTASKQGLVLMCSG
jgi:hypothetical protein